MQKDCSESMEIQEESVGSESTITTEDVPSELPKDCFPFLLACKPSKNAPLKIIINKHIVQLGRDAKCDYQIDSTRKPRMISRIHALITYNETENEVTISDMKSVNGIFVNFVKVRSAKLRNNDVVIFGEGGDLKCGMKLKICDPELTYVFNLGRRNKKRKRSSQEVDTNASPKKRRELELPQLITASESEGDTIILSQEELRKIREEGCKLKAEEIKRIREETEKRIKLEAGEAIKAEIERIRAEEKRQKEEIEKKLQEETARLQQQESEIRTRQEEERRKTQQRLSELQSMLAQKEELLSAHQMRVKQLQEMKEKEKKEQEMLYKEKMVVVESQLEMESMKINTIRQEVDAEKKRLAEQLAQSKQELASLKATTLRQTDIQEEFICCICHELMVETTVLGCAHAFCGECLEDWLNVNQICPICRKKVKSTPMRALNIDNVIAKIVEKMNPEDSTEWKKQAEKRIKLRQSLRDLQQLITTARRQKLKFLSIKDSWNEDEKKVFHKGVSQYSGKCREIYCSTTGLTRDFINKGSSYMIRRGFLNVDIPLLDSESLNDTALLRQKLLHFITAEAEPERTVMS